MDIDKALGKYNNNSPENPKCRRCGDPVVTGELCQHCKRELEYEADMLESWRERESTKRSKSFQRRLRCPKS